MNLPIAQISHLCMIFILGIPFELPAQTDNDNIENRVEILEDTPIRSFTNGNSVQWKCVDEKLTGKCIKYHNDQWFYFKALHGPVQFINISKQECRDIWGVQLVVIEGIPCETETYQIKSCISLGTQDDIFATLDNLESGKEYLLNIDGYLHDFCQFEMELSLTPKGLPATQTIQLEASGYTQNDSLKYFWITPDSLLKSVSSYSLFKRKSNEFKFRFLRTFPARLDSYGEPINEYYYAEILTGENDPWTYKLVADISGLAFTVDEFSTRSNSHKGVSARHRIYPDISYQKKMKLEITLTDYVLGIALEQMSIHYFPRDFKPVYFDVTEYIDLGVTRFQIIVKNVDTGKREYLDYEYQRGVGVEKMRGKQ